MVSAWGLVPLPRKLEVKEDWFLLAYKAYSLHHFCTCTTGNFACFSDWISVGIGTQLLRFNRACKIGPRLTNDTGMHREKKYL